MTRNPPFHSVLKSRSEMIKLIFIESLVTLALPVKCFSQSSPTCPACCTPVTTPSPAPACPHPVPNGRLFPAGGICQWASEGDLGEVHPGDVGQGVAHHNQVELSEVLTATKC